MSSRTPDQSRGRRSFRLPITVKVTIWYTFFIVLLMGVMVAASFFVTREISQSITEKDLVKKTQEMARQDDDFEAFDEGIYFSIYSSDNVLKRGTVPKNFNKSLPPEQGSVNSYAKGKSSFIYTDVTMRAKSKGTEAGDWIRGVVSTTKETEKFLYFPVGISLAAPLLILIIAFGGYRIIKSAFKPVRTIVSSASDIGRSKDFTKRIRLKSSKNDEIHNMTRVFNEMLDSLEDSYNRERQFSGDVSHELRTPVSVILAESQYGLEHADTLDEAKASFAVVERQSRRMTHMINQILEISKLDQMEALGADPVDLSRVAREIAGDHALAAEEKHLKLMTDIQGDVVVKGDRALLERALDNLISNGIKFAKANLWISLKGDRDEIFLAVSDDGRGIPPEEVENLWQRFYQLDASRNKEGNSGSGLGLSIVKRIVDLHRGEIEVTPRPGGGSIFRIILKK